MANLSLGPVSLRDRLNLSGGSWPYREQTTGPTSLSVQRFPHNDWGSYVLCNTCKYSASTSLYIGHQIQQRDKNKHPVSSGAKETKEQHDLTNDCIRHGAPALSSLGLRLSNPGLPNFSINFSMHFAGGTAYEQVCMSSSVTGGPPLT